MGRLFLVDLEGRAYRCRFCVSDLALADDVLSRVLLIIHMPKVCSFCFMFFLLCFAVDQTHVKIYYVLYLTVWFFVLAL